MPISMKALLWVSPLIFIGVIFLFCYSASAQTSASSGTIQGVVTDQTNAVVAGAQIQIHNPVSGYNRTVISDEAGKFTIPNVPFNPYHLSVTGKGFAPYAQDVDVRSVVPLNLSIGLKVTGATETVTVEAGAADLIEADTT